MKVKFLPMNKEVEITPEQTVLEVALANQVPIRTVCKGVPACAECRVRIVEGENNVLPPAKAELNLIGSGYFVDHRRLSCQLHCYGNVTVDVSEQLAKTTDTSLRKMRGGGKKGTVTESRAIQDTYLLKEKPAADAAGESEETNEK
jgi:2Fe-2S ferredoxin